MALIIFGIVVTAILVILYSLIVRFVRKTFELKTTDLTTPLSEFKESARSDKLVVSRGMDTPQNIAAQYELMCLKDPLRYQHDPQLPDILEKYRKLLKGELSDPEGRHVPSEFLNGDRNPDYETYVKAQRKCYSGYKGEEKRLKAALSEEDVILEFAYMLLNMGLSADVVNVMLNEEKLNSFKAADWKKLSSRVKEYLQSYDQDKVIGFLMAFDDLETLMDSEKLEIFSCFRDHQAPMEIAVEIVRGRVSMDQAVRIAALVYSHGYTWRDAMEEVLEEDRKTNQEQDLRDKYRSIIQS